MVPYNQIPRVVLFGSFYRGYYLLKELLLGDLKDHVKVVGVATDDPSNSFVSPNKRVWQYPHTDAERSMVKDLANEFNIEVYTGKIKSDFFYKIFEKRWRAGLCLMGTFGQLISPRLFNYPKLGFFNFHPCCDEKWPSYIGGNPFKLLMEDKRKYAVIAMHHVNEEFDKGELVAFSEKIPIPVNASVIDMHKISAPFAAKLAARELKRIINEHSIAQTNYCLQPCFS